MLGHCLGDAQIRGPGAFVHAASCHGLVSDESWCMYVCGACIGSTVHGLLKVWVETFFYVEPVHTRKVMSHVSARRSLTSREAALPRRELPLVIGTDISLFYIRCV